MCPEQSPSASPVGDQPRQPAGGHPGKHAPCPPQPEAPPPRAGLGSPAGGQDAPGLAISRRSSPSRPSCCSSRCWSLALQGDTGVRLARLAGLPTHTCARPPPGGAAPRTACGLGPHLYISSDSSRSRSCFSWMSRNQSTMSASSESSAKRSRAGCRAGQRPARCPQRQAGCGQGWAGGWHAPGAWGPAAGTASLTPLSRPEALLQLHAPGLQGVQLPLDTLNLLLDLFRGHVVGVQLGTKWW